jgi:hypothetical protein
VVPYCGECTTEVRPVDSKPTETIPDKPTDLLRFVIKELACMCRDYGVRFTIEPIGEEAEQDAPRPKRAL